MKSLVSFAILSIAFAANAGNSTTTAAPNDKLAMAMTKACATEIKKWCANKKTPEDVYTCIEAKEKAHVKYSKGCDDAHEAYEASYHNDVYKAERMPATTKTN